MNAPLTALLCAWTAAAPADTQKVRTVKPSSIELQVQVEQAAARMELAHDNLLVVEKQYTQRRDKGTADVLKARFSNGELRYLLGEYRTAAVILDDLLRESAFTNHPSREDALFYLADSLLQSDNLAGSKVYFRQVLGMKGRRYREALLRYVDAAGRTNDFTGIDDFVAAARTDKGELSPELAYTYGKWSFRRKDLSAAERLARVRAAFGPLAEDEKGYYRLQATYYLAVAQVQEGRFEDAVATFRRITMSEASSERDLRTRELAWLSLGRVFYEMGKFSEALDAYQEIPRDSESFIDSLFETAWTRVKKEEFQKARDATELLALVAPESPVVPEAQILQGNLSARMKQYQAATDTYDTVINQYAPVRDELDALLSVNKDPVAYFDRLLANNERGLSVGDLLPPVARKWATAQQEVARAVTMVNDLEAGRRNVGEANEIADRILRTLDERGLETFPELQEGYKRADAVASALTDAEESLTRLEIFVLEEVLTPEQLGALERLRAEQDALQPKFASLPTTEAELGERTRRIQGRADEADRVAFRVSTEIQSCVAQIAAIQRYAQEVRAKQATTPEQEKEFELALRSERNTLEGLQKLLDDVRQKIATERSMASGSVSGDEEIRRRYAKNLAEQQALLARAAFRAPPEMRPLLSRVGQVRGRGAEVKRRTDEAKRALRAQVQARGAEIRARVQAEQQLLSGYGGDVTVVGADARQLVGRIAFDSFRRVRQQFYDLVLKADVGIVDVAFSRKQDNTQSIQKLSTQKDRELRQLEEEFREVLREVD